MRNRMPAGSITTSGGSGSTAALAIPPHEAPVEMQFASKIDESGAV